MRDDYILKNVRNVPINIKRAILNEALVQGVTMNDIIGQVLGARWSVYYEPSGEKSVGGDIDGDQLLFRIPVELDLEIRTSARYQKITESSVVLQTLAMHFGLTYAPTKRGGRKPRART